MGNDTLLIRTSGSICVYSRNMFSCVWVMGLASRVGVSTWKNRCFVIGLSPALYFCLFVTVSIAAALRQER